MRSAFRCQPASGRSAKSARQTCLSAKLNYGILGARGRGEPAAFWGASESRSLRASSLARPRRPARLDTVDRTSLPSRPPQAQGRASSTSAQLGRLLCLLAQASLPELRLYLLAGAPSFRNLLHCSLPPDCLSVVSAAKLEPNGKLVA